MNPCAVPVNDSEIMIYGGAKSLEDEVIYIFRATDAYPTLERLSNHGAAENLVQFPANQAV